MKRRYNPQKAFRINSCFHHNLVLQSWKNFVKVFCNETAEELGRAMRIKKKNWKEWGNILFYRKRIIIEHHHLSKFASLFARTKPNVITNIIHYTLITLHLYSYFGLWFRNSVCYAYVHSSESAITQTHASPFGIQSKKNVRLNFSTQKWLRIRERYVRSLGSGGFLRKCLICHILEGNFGHFSPFQM